MLLSGFQVLLALIGQIFVFRFESDLIQACTHLFLDSAECFCRLGLLHMRLIEQTLTLFNCFQSIFQSFFADGTQTKELF